ncbi:hypothetical protein C7445_10981 [Alicyclobacillus sacchari]|uniref:Uncharacterized protein n=1 Tax=Alicyclobacillus sacchari TaxID=392010 RepID=A0A4V3HE76_9BACL|nr:hypothetical protein [Alicyclobacillus sacchari]TDY44583.1 hypothetical protein C7445_10981 [Alicyclobacillus sacchari]GMA57936.1 hypothetical protein GCM10025858_24390 [Alicyclobacillus sacchari]
MHIRRQRLDIRLHFDEEDNDEALLEMAEDLPGFQQDEQAASGEESH